MTIDPKQTHLTVSGIDRQKVGFVAAEMRSLRPPDPYKNKGVRYTDERLKKKVGKTGAKIVAGCQLSVVSDLTLAATVWLRSNE